ncbi:shikimate dehydrogenase [Rhizobiaceae bacterium n13]|uniref:Shikimate dehydrogenase n=1 Tax=Ferirhizobium litorale TaxID=2927786 RepID=A0AAE3QDR8_9HYPH|nr:shikimate dehydrogenase [Fererhizobium litorale]MDI7862650.1 shikimate dehydrogenase [Fererhizobium litorale]MDI7923867.1 shikimate dehydrogenase [Fererhizobium litorale]
MEPSNKPIRAALVGSSIQASLTPAMHMAEGRRQGLDYRYDLVDLALLGGGAELLPGILARAAGEKLVGLNITHPCKQAVIAYLDQLSEDAAALGAVNTVVFKEGRRHGHNTDWWGFAEAFRLKLPGAGLGRVVQLGAGGAGAATAYAILRLGAGRLAIFDPDRARAELLVETMRQCFPRAEILVGVDIRAEMEDASGLVHATPTGMANYPGLPIDPDLLHRRHWVAEIVYFPLETELLAEARRCGCRVTDGGGMAVLQAVGAYRLFTGREADAARMLQHFQTLTRPSPAEAAT